MPLVSALPRPTLSRDARLSVGRRVSDLERLVAG